MNNKKLDISKKYNIPYNNIKDNQLEYYYTTIPELCCKYNLKEISDDVGPFEFTKAIKIMNDYYNDIKCDYYRNLTKEIEKYGDDISKYQLDIADRIILEYIKFRKNTYCLTIWPYIKGDISNVVEFLKKYGNVYHTKKIKLNYNGALNLVYQLYSDTKRFPTIDKLKEKLDYLGWREGENNIIRVIFFENTSNEVISGSQAQLKTKIRNFMLDIIKKGKIGSSEELHKDDKNLRGDDLVHINDYFYQTIEYAKIFLHKKTISFLRKQNLNRHLSNDFCNCRMYLNTLKNWIVNNIDPIDYERFVFMGSVVLYAYGIRQCRDIDGLVSGIPKNSKTKNFTQKIAEYFYDRKTKFMFADIGLIGTSYWKPQWDEKDLAWFEKLKIKDRDELIFNPDYHFYYNGIKLISLKSELVRKYIRKRYYDYGDLLMAVEISNIKIKLPKVPNTVNLDELMKTSKQYLMEKYHLPESKANELIKNIN